MPKTLVFSEKFQDSLLKISARNRKQIIKIEKTLQTLLENPQAKSLRLHKLAGSEYWSISVDMSTRIIVSFDKDLIHLLKIGSHDQVY